MLQMGFPCGSAGKETNCDVGDLGSIPVWGRSPGEGKGYPLQYSGLENPWTVQSMGLQSQTRLSDVYFTYVADRYFIYSGMTKAKQNYSG